MPLISFGVMLMIADSFKLTLLMLLLTTALSPSVLRAAENTDPLPQNAAVVQLVASSEAREQSLITVLALKLLSQHYQKAQAELASADQVSPDPVEAATAEAQLDYVSLLSQFSDDRAWLQSLVTRPLHQTVEPIDLRSSSYFSQVLRLRLYAHNLAGDEATASVDAILEDLLLKLVFEHKQQGILRALMPYLLRRAEASLLLDWKNIEHLAEQDSGFSELLSQLDLQILMPINDVAAETIKPKNLEKQILADFTSLLQLLSLQPETVIQQSDDAQSVESTALAVDEFSTLVFKLRHDLLSISAEYDVLLPLYTLDILTALRTGNDLVFVNGLILLATSMLDQSETVWVAESAGDILPASNELKQRQNYPTDSNDWWHQLSAALLEIQQSYSAEFSQVDLGLNRAMAMAVEVLRQASVDQFNYPEQRRELLDARAILDPLLPDLTYFHQPIRERIREEIEVCASIAAASLQQGQNITAEQFDGCINAFKDMGLNQAANIPLAGNSRGPWEPDQLRRELNLTPWQRVNYLLAYLRNEYANDCTDESRLINPLEWSLQSTVMAWFAVRWPAFAGTDASEDVFEEMLSKAGAFNRQIETNKSCLSSAEDLVQQILVRYGQRLDELINSINSLEQQFRDEKLALGADIKLDQGAAQKTNYRPADLQILPCNPEKICEMSAPLSANLALMGLFPEPYLVADQSKMGQIEICYDQVRWLNRRQSPARENDPDVSNYYGQLSFSIKGRFHQGDALTEVFEREFVSPDEYLYLFASSEPTVLAAECPMNLVGQPVITKLRNTRFPGIVPDRLTYLAAARTLPSRLFSDNWDKGAQWHDWFVTGSGVKIITESDGSELFDSVNNYLHTLSETREAMLYSALLSPPLNSNSKESLAQRVSALSLEKSLLRSVLSIFYGDLLRNNDQLRAGLTGQSGLLDTRVLRRLREAAVPIGDIGQLGRKRTLSFSELWASMAATELSSRQSMLSVSPMLAVAWLQLKHLQNLHFSQQALPEESAVTERPDLNAAELSADDPEK